MVMVSACDTGKEKAGYHQNKNGTFEKNYQKDIDVIYFSHWAIFRAEDDTTAYKVDLKNNTFSMIDSGAEYSQAKWGTEEGDADFKLVCMLEDDAIDSFFRESARFGFTLWKQSYTDKSVLDGSHWYIKICFSDGTTREMSGTNKFPDTWNDMMGAFNKLTGHTFKASGG